jgi:hypothetical protein
MKSLIFLGCIFLIVIVVGTVVNWDSPRNTNSPPNTQVPAVPHDGTTAQPASLVPCPSCPKPGADVTIRAGAWSGVILVVVGQESRAERIEHVE